MCSPVSAEIQLKPAFDRCKPFKTERSQTTLTAGKVLLSLKTKGLGERNEVKTEYRQALRSVKQGVSEAILQEQIPPGYKDAIQQYFDSIDEPAKRPGPDK